ncbi:MAG: hypothetical protein AABZ09_06295 [Candidatus Binatota bacterium]
MESLQGLVFSQLGIPAWQILLYIDLSSFFMLSRRTRFCLMTTYLFALYWIFHLFRVYWLSTAEADFLVLTAYILFGFTQFGLLLYAFFFFSERYHFPGFSSFEIGRLQRTLLKRIDQMEMIVVKAEARTVHEIQQFEGLKQKIETRIGPIENRVEKMDEVLGQREFAVQGLETGVLTQLHELQSQLRKNEELLQSRDKEIQDLRLEMEEKSVRFQLQLQEEEEGIKRESPWKESEEKLHAAIHDLERQLTEKEALLLARNLEIKDLRLDVGERAGVLESQLQALKAQLAERESSFKENEEGLSARVRGLEEDLREREAQLKGRDQEIQNIRSDLETKIVWLQGQILETEQYSEEQESSFTALREELNGRIQELESQLRERDRRPRTHDGEAEFPSPGAEVKIDSLQALLKEQEESFVRRAASFKEVMESLTDRIHQLECQLKEKEGLLETREEEGKKRQTKRLRPSGSTGERVKDLHDNIEAELEKIKAGLREGEMPLRQEK